MKIPALGEALEAPTIKVQVQALVALNETMQGDDDLPQPNNAYLFDINHLVTEMGIVPWHWWL
nr:uncharacterized protein LOC109164950 [Ipomoea batatas]